jgi:L-threonylcarbamoyladenylate synthase
MTYESLSPDAAGLTRAGELLRAGRLVAFPTETVYGLGANALDEAAVLSIFTCKGRPLTDPLIVHIAEPAQAYELVELPDGAGLELFRALAARFWPGPLTLVAKARPQLPMLLTAGTGFVGLRVPQHPVARALLVEAGVPIAAPSANRFGHVSPTLAAHVVADLGSSTVGGGIAVIDNDGASAAADVAEEEDGDSSGGSGGGGSGGGSEASCGVGIESTVAKVDVETGEVVVFRRGGVSQASLQAVLDEGRFPFTIRCLSKKASEHDEEGLQAPGQMLTHYAPDVETFLVRELALLPPSSPSSSSSSSPSSSVVVRAREVDDDGVVQGGGGEGGAGTDVNLASCVVIDFNRTLASLQKLRPLAYRDISPVRARACA